MKLLISAQTGTTCVTLIILLEVAFWTVQDIRFS